MTLLNQNRRFGIEKSCCPVQLTYFGMLGHESCNLIGYLEGFQGVAPIKRGHNPATWMLEVTGGATSNNIKASQQDFPEVYKVWVV